MQDAYSCSHTTLNARVGEYGGSGSAISVAVEMRRVESTAIMGVRRDGDDDDDDDVGEV